MRILLVEDDPDDAFLMRKILSEASSESLRFEVEQVSRLEAALRSLASEKVDAILLDLSLPDSRGLETFTTLHSKFREFPVVVLTGLNDEQVAIEAMQRGAQDYLTKGEVDGRMLRRVLTYAVERKKLDRMKDDFIGTVSHELRTPLSTTLSALSNLKDGVVGTLTDPQKNYLEIARRNLSRLGQIILNLLDLSRLESGEVNVDRRPVQPGALIHEAIQGFQPLSLEKKISLKTEWKEPLREISADAEMLTQVLNNLLDNALRYAREKVTLKVHQNGAGLELTVADDGPGIPSERIGDLFNKFVQINRPEGGGYKGTGLGLAICKKIADLHDGKIWVESELGHGSAFHFKIPWPKKETPS